MKYAVVLAAWIVFCGFQQPSAPSGKADQKTANAGHTKTNNLKPKALPLPPPSASSPDAETQGVKGNGNENIQIVAPTPEKSVDPVERGISIIGVICTLTLAGVGIYGIIIALRTIAEMTRQREVMMLQLRATNETLSEVSQQTASLKEYVAETKKISDSSLKAANASAEATQAMKEANRQSAEFFKAEKRPWIGMNGTLSLLEKKSTKSGQYGFTVGYTIKNFGVAPAFNTIVALSPTVDDGNNYELVKSGVNEARKMGENILNRTGDLLLPGAEKTDTCRFAEIPRGNKFVIPGCIVYRFADGTVHHTQLSYWIDFDEGEKAIFRTVWFQAAD
jgi:hypothetical protein